MMPKCRVCHKIASRVNGSAIEIDNLDELCRLSRPKPTDIRKQVGAVKITDGIVDFLQSLLVLIAFGSRYMQQFFYSRKQLFSTFHWLTLLG